MLLYPFTPCNNFPHSSTLGYYPSPTPCLPSKTLWWMPFKMESADQSGWSQVIHNVEKYIAPSPLLLSPNPWQRHEDNCPGSLFAYVWQGVIRAHTQQLENLVILTQWATGSGACDLYLEHVTTMKLFPVDHTGSCMALETQSCTQEVMVCSSKA